MKGKLETEMAMKNLFLLDGVAGTGKSDCIKYIQDGYRGEHTAGVLQKYTTRPPRKEEENKNYKIDLEFISQSEFDKIKTEEGTNFLSYRYGDDTYGYYMYGIKKSDIDIALSKYENVFLIIRNIKCIKTMENIYKNQGISDSRVYLFGSNKSY